MAQNNETVCAEARELIDEAHRCVDEDACQSLRQRAYALLTPLVEEEYPEALYLYACYLLSFESLDDDAHDKRHLELIKQAAEAGHAKAQFALGQLYDDEDALGPDPAASAYWFEKSALQGYPYAQWVHGLTLLEKDRALALDFIQQAAEGKFEGAIQFIADAHAAGTYGFKQDQAAAEVWRRRLIDPDVIHY